MPKLGKWAKNSPHMRLQGHYWRRWEMVATILSLQLHPSLACCKQMVAPDMSGTNGLSCHPCWPPNMRDMAATPHIPHLPRPCRTSPATTAVAPPRHSTQLCRHRIILRVQLQAGGWVDGELGSAGEVDQVREGKGDGDAATGCHGRCGKEKRMRRKEEEEGGGRRAFLEGFLTHKWIKQGKNFKWWISQAL